MKRSDLCYGKHTVRTETPDRVYRRLGGHPYFEAFGDDVYPKGIKRIRLTCPKCKRRLLSSIEVCHDGCCTYHTLPPHKPRGWWKKRKKRKKREEKQVKRR